MLEVLRSGRLSLGPMGERFEREFAELARGRGRGHGLQRHHRPAPRRAGARVGPRRRGSDQPLQLRRLRQLPLYEGAKPVFCDVDPLTLNLDRDAAAAAVGERTKGILPIHIFGYPAAMPELEALAARHDLDILEDACEAIGASDYEGRGVGTRGNLATFAFYANKQMTTGEGGMIVPSDGEAAAAPAQRAQPGAGRRHGLARARGPRLQLPAFGRRRRPRRRPGREARLAAGASRRGRLALRAAPLRGRGSRGPARQPRQGAAQLVRLRRPSRRRGRARRDDRQTGAERDRQQGLPALHPPLPAPARARLPRGSVPGRRSRRRPLAGAAFLPGDERGRGGPCLPGARRGARPAAR